MRPLPDWTAMFSNRALQLTMVKKNRNAPVDESTKSASRNYDEIAQITMYHAGHAAKLIVTGLVAHKLLTTVCEIAVITAVAKIK